MPMPRCSSTAKSFFWYEESSSALRWVRTGKHQLKPISQKAGVGGGVRRGGVPGPAGMSGTFIAQRTACVLLVRPTTTDPCLTDSAAYSIWKMRPCGELLRS